MATLLQSLNSSHYLGHHDRRPSQVFLPQILDPIQQLMILHNVVEHRVSSSEEGMGRDSRHRTTCASSQSPCQAAYMGYKIFPCLGAVAEPPKLNRFKCANYHLNS